ncbi:hypothetical protein BDN72DRAFT_742461, partial [Pluteus cervinus]
VEINALFDDGAMVNTINQHIYEGLKHEFGMLKPSRKRLRMANGNVVIPVGCFEGEVHVADVVVRDVFEIFRSDDGWEVLVGKPLKVKLHAIHDYGLDEIIIGGNKGTTLRN